MKTRGSFVSSLYLLSSIFIRPYRQVPQTFPNTLGDMQVVSDCDANSPARECSCLTERHGYIAIVKVSGLTSLEGV